MIYTRHCKESLGRRGNPHYKAFNFIITMLEKHCMDPYVALCAPLDDVTEAI